MQAQTAGLYLVAKAVLNACCVGRNMPFQYGCHQPMHAHSISVPLEMHQDKLLTDAAAAAGMLIFVTYAAVQARQLGSAVPTYNVYDLDNYPQVCPLQAFFVLSHDRQGIT